MKKAVLILLIVLAAISFSAPVFGECREPQVVTDVLLARPLGLAATIVGAAVFVISLPFSVPTGSVGTVADALVTSPARYTFVRPIGDFSTEWERRNLPCRQ